MTSQAESLVTDTKEIPDQKTRTKLTSALIVANDRFYRCGDVAA